MKLFFVLAFLVTFASFSEALKRGIEKKTGEPFNVLNAVCDDIYKIGVSEAEGTAEFGKNLLTALDKFLEGEAVDIYVGKNLAEASKLASKGNELNLLRKILDVARFDAKITENEASVLRALETVEEKVEAYLEDKYAHVTIVVPSVINTDPQISADLKHVKETTDPENLTVEYGCKLQGAQAPLPNCTYGAFSMYRNIHQHLVTLHEKFKQELVHSNGGFFKNPHYKNADDTFDALVSIFESGDVLVNWDVQAEFNQLRYTLYDQLHSVTICFDFFMEAIEESQEYLSQNGEAGFSILHVDTNSKDKNNCKHVKLDEKANAEKELDLDSDLDEMAELDIKDFLIVKHLKAQEAHEKRRASKNAHSAHKAASKGHKNLAKKHKKTKK